VNGSPDKGKGQMDSIAVISAGSHETIGVIFEVTKVR
jgi:hypothetical protein